MSGMTVSGHRYLGPAVKINKNDSSPEGSGGVSKKVGGSDNKMSKLVSDRLEKINQGTITSSNNNMPPTSHMKYLIISPESRELPHTEVNGTHMKILII